MHDLIRIATKELAALLSLLLIVLGIVASTLL